MQLKIILNGVTSLELLFFGAFLLLFRIKYCLFQQGCLGERCKLPWGGAPEAEAFLGFTWPQILQRRLKLLFS